MSEGKAGVPIEPVRRSVTVSWNVASAFQRFTAQIASWWPLRSHSVSGEQAVSCVFEQHVGGKIYEVARDGARSEWGTVLVWDPPGRVEFTWHPGSGPEVASRVELRFSAVAGGTRLDLTHTGWEVFGRNAQKMRRGYNVGWVYVLNLWADRRTPMVMMMALIIGVATPFVRWKERREASRVSTGSK